MVRRVILQRIKAVDLRHIGGFLPDQSGRTSSWIDIASSTLAVMTHGDPSFRLHMGECGGLVGTGARVLKPARSFFTSSHHLPHSCQHSTRFQQSLSSKYNMYTTRPHRIATPNHFLADAGTAWWPRANRSDDHRWVQIYKYLLCTVRFWCPHLASVGYEKTPCSYSSTEYWHMDTISML